MCRCPAELSALSPDDPLLVDYASPPVPKDEENSASKLLTMVHELALVKKYAGEKRTIFDAIIKQLQHSSNDTKDDSHSGDEDMK
jgi:hypothetical protein